MFLSFIIPVYNTERYLDVCISSLLHQDLPHSDYEIICINDGSTDHSLDIMKKWESEAENVVVIDQRNAGVCTARNTGLDKAVGDYIWFIDSET